MSVKLEDYSIEVKAELNDITLAWLHKWGNEIASHAKRNCQTVDDKGQLRKSYRADFDDGDGVAEIGSPLESAYWEEFGTGSHADTSKSGHGSRHGWWIYTPGSKGPEDYESNYYATKEDAERMAAYIRKRYKKKAVVTNGRDPSYTLQKAFEKNKNPAEADLERKLRGGMK